MRISAYHARRARVESPGAAFAIPRLPIDRYGLLLGLALVVLFLIAWQRVSAHPGLLGADIGNYLLTERKVFEGDPTGLGFLRPPLVAIPIWIATALLELETATKALAVLAWLATGIPVYVLMRRLTGRDGVGGLIAAFAAVAYLLSTPFAGMLVWGWITFLALALALVPLVALPLLGDLGRREWGRIVLLATVLMLVAATHQVTTLFVAVWLLLAGGGLVLIEDRRALWLLARAVPVTLLLSIWLVPLYLQVGGGAEGSFLGTGLRGWSELSVGFRFFFRDPHAGFWLALVVLATVEMLRRIAFAGSPEDRRSGVLLGSMLLASLGLFAVDGDLAPRMPYYAALPIWALSASALAGALRFAGRRAWLAMPAGGLAMIGLAVLAGLLTVRFDERLEGSLSFWVARAVERETVVLGGAGASSRD